MEGVHRSTQFFLNRPNIRELREVSEKFYATWRELRMLGNGFAEL